MSMFRYLLMSSMLLAVSLAPVLAENPAASRIAAAKAAQVEFVKSAPFTYAGGMNETYRKGSSWAAYAAGQKFAAEATFMKLDAAALSSLKARKPEHLRLEIPFRKAEQGTLRVDLFRVDIFAAGFKVSSSSGLERTGEVGIHFRGTIADEPDSFAAFSIFEGSLTGLVSSQHLGQVNIGRLGEVPTKTNRLDYVAYSMNDVVMELPSSYCSTNDDQTLFSSEPLFEGMTGSSSVDPAELASVSSGEITKAAGGCLRFYFETHQSLFNRMGTVTAVTEWVTGTFNQIAAIYAQDDITGAISEIFVWDTKSPYGSSEPSQSPEYTLDHLRAFQEYRPSYNGDVGQLLRMGSVGGVADDQFNLGTVCHADKTRRQSFSTVKKGYNDFPNYSYTVQVMAHEIGHSLGSFHTHACKWFGTSSAIDSCPGFVEGSCYLPGDPPGGVGTLMSYCALSGGSVDFSEGFHPQPAKRIKRKLANSDCLPATCG